jgi:hypothetical protein
VRKLFDRVVAAGIDRKLSSNALFTVDGTLVRSLANQKRVERVEGRESEKEAHLSHSMHVLMENRSGLCPDVRMDAADGKAERRSALAILGRFKRRHGLSPATLGADAGYDDGDFFLELEKAGITPHVAMKRGRTKAKDEKGDARRRAARRVGQVGYELSQRA